MIPITRTCAPTYRRDFAHFGQLTPKGTNPVLWPSFPKRLQSALNALCCLAQSGNRMRSQKIAERIRVSNPETAKILQLLVWGGFVTSRRGTKGGFRLATRADQIMMGDVIDFFLSRHSSEPQDDFVMMRVLREMSAPCQKAFSNLRLADIASGCTTHSRKRLNPKKI